MYINIPVVRDTDHIEAKTYAYVSELLKRDIPESVIRKRVLLAVQNYLEKNGRLIIIRYCRVVSCID